MRYQAALHPDTREPLPNRRLRCKWRFCRERRPRSDGKLPRRQQRGKMAAQHRVLERLGDEGTVAMARLKIVGSHCRRKQEWNAAFVKRIGNGGAHPVTN